MVDAENLYDAVIVGAGPAGLTAALYLARARYRVLVVEKDHFGGQITITDEVVNYPGVLAASGKELAETMRRQAQAFGAEFLLAEATALDMAGEVKTVHTSRGDVYCLSVLLATGASPRKGGFEGEEAFQGHGVAYCATCDGEFFTGKDVFVVGGGFAAAEEAVFLTKYARHVTIVVRGDSFSCAPAASEEARNHPKITVRYHTVVKRVEGDGTLRTIVLQDVRTGKEERFASPDGSAIGVFVFVGYAPATTLAQGLAQLDDTGYVVTDTHQATTCPGLFAAGDVCAKPLRQVATAVGQAATTATEMERFIKRAQEETGLSPRQDVTRVPSAPSSRSDAEKGAASRNGAKPGKTAATSESDALFTQDMVEQLNAVFERMASPLVLRLSLDERPVSAELQEYAEALSSLTDKLSVEIAPDPQGHLPFVEICDADGHARGMAFHGVPGGHEFTSFVLGLYNAAGPGQPIDEADRSAIAAIDRPVHLQVLVGLSCTMCPEVVVACQRIAADNELVRADVYDINHFGDLKDRYDVMSVPCLVIDDGAQVEFGKKSLSQVLDLLK